MAIRGVDHRQGCMAQGCRAVADPPAQDRLQPVPASTAVAPSPAGAGQSQGTTGTGTNTSATPTAFSGSYAQAVLQQAAGDFGGKEQQHVAAAQPHADPGRGQPARAPGPVRDAAPANGVSRQRQSADGGGWRQQGGPRLRANPNRARGQPNRGPRGRAGGAARPAAQRGTAPCAPKGNAAARQPATSGDRVGAAPGNSIHPAPPRSGGGVVYGGSGGDGAGTATAKPTAMFKRGTSPSFLDVARKG